MSFGLRLDTQTWILLGVVAVLLAGLLYFYMQKSDSGKHHPGYQRDGFDHPDTNVPGPEQTHDSAPSGPAPGPEQTSPILILFHADWCPHCKDFMPEWQKLTKMLDGKLMCGDVESKSPIMAAHKIGGFPTIRLFPKGMGSPDVHQDYNGPRTAQDIMNFLSPKKQ